MSLHVKVSPTGRMSIPADVRKRLGLEGGGTLLLEETDQGVTLTTFQQRVRRAQALVREYMKGKPGFTVDDFIAEKHAEAAREEEEFERDRP